MKIESLSFVNLRNYSQCELEFNPTLNIFHGLNGSGKTTILEAISIAGFSKSFLPVQESSIIKFGETGYQVSSNSRSDLSIPYKVTVNNKIGSRKQINTSIGDNLYPKDIIGKIPLVILSPDFKVISFGAPQDRREFIDRLLSQASKSYIEELIKFKKVLKQRNSLLQDAKFDRFFKKDLLEPWTEMLIDSSVEIEVKRYKFAKDFQVHFKNYYKIVSNGIENVDLLFTPNTLEKFELDETSSKEQIKDIYVQEQKKLFGEEIRRGTTLFGPQKDELKITINEGIARETASQGQHKSLLIGLKFAEFEFLKERRKETPIILLDDLFSELDAKRVFQVMDLLFKSEAQTFITSTEAATLRDILPDAGKRSIFNINSGIVKKES